MSLRWCHAWPSLGPEHDACSIEIDAHQKITSLKIRSLQEGHGGWSGGKTTKRNLGGFSRTQPGVKWLMTHMWFYLSPNIPDPREYLKWKEYTSLQHRGTDAKEIASHPFLPFCFFFKDVALVLSAVIVLQDHTFVGLGQRVPIRKWILFNFQWSRKKRIPREEMRT